jgi:hypothetical protein
MARSVDDLTNHCRRSLANYKIPRRVEFSETELPKSGSGKILKWTLRERFGESRTGRALIPAMVRSSRKKITSKWFSADSNAARWAWTRLTVAC